MPVKAPRLKLVLQTGFGALASAAVPIGALLTLDATEYGTFSLAYLMFALGWSLELSLICDTWTRSIRDSLRPSGWREFSQVLLQLGILSGLLGGALIFLFFGDVASAVAMAFAVLFNLYRLGGRYFTAASVDTGRATLSDALTVAVFISSWLSCLPFIELGLLPFSVIWALSNLVGALVFLPKFSGRPYGIGSWIRSHRRTIKPLLTDSILLDVGSIAVPTFFAPTLGAASFGIYRSISSVATPVQLILDPLRPVLSQINTRTTSSAKIAASVTGAAGFLAAACYLVLVFVVPQTFLASTVLGSLSAFALPASVFVASNLFGHFYYVCSRGQLDARRLYTGRVVQTLLSIGLPTAGLLAGGLSGAIWGFTVASTASALFWFALVRRQSAAIPA